MRASQVRRWHTVALTRKRVTGLDEYGAPSFETSIIYARVVHKSKRARTPEGEDVTSSTQVQTLDELAIGDVLTIDSLDRRIMAIEQATSLAGGLTVTEAML